jgi:hypothetical protein
MSARATDQLSKLLLAARQSPEFGLRLLAELSPESRAEAIRRWCQVSSPEVSSVALRPGLKKCGVGRAAPNNGLSAQLEAFARSIGGVGQLR